MEEAAALRARAAAGDTTATSAGVAASATGPLAPAAAAELADDTDMRFAACALRMTASGTCSPCSGADAEDTAVPASKPSEALLAAAKLFAEPSAGSAAALAFPSPCSSASRIEYCGREERVFITAAAYGAGSKMPPPAAASGMQAAPPTPSAPVSVSTCKSDSVPSPRAPTGAAVAIPKPSPDIPLGFAIASRRETTTGAADKPRRLARSGTAAELAPVKV